MPTKGLGVGLGREMLDLDVRIMGAAIDDPATCVVLERFLGRLWPCTLGNEGGGTPEALGGGAG